MFNWRSTEKRIMELHRQGEYEKMLRESDRMVDGMKDPTLVRRLRADALYRLGRYDDVIRECHTAAENDTLAPARWFASASKLYCELEKYDAALNETEECIRISPDYPLWRIDKALILVRLGRHAEAVRYCDSVITRWPMEPSIHAVKGDALAGLNEYDKAILCYEMAMHLDPKDAYPRERCNILLVRQNQEATRISHE